MRQDELMHYGVLGMKWGVRKAEYKGTGRGKGKILKDLDRVSSKTAKAFSDRASWDKQTKFLIDYEGKKQTVETGMHHLTKSLGSSIAAMNALSKLKKKYGSNLKISEIKMDDHDFAPNVRKAMQFVINDKSGTYMSEIKISDSELKRFKNLMSNQTYVQDKSEGDFINKKTGKKIRF